MVILLENVCCHLYFSEYWLVHHKKEELIATHPSADHAQYDLKAETDWTRVTIHVFHISHWWKMEKCYC
jgi:hypothetical protein